MTHSDDADGAEPTADRAVSSANQAKTEPIPAADDVAGEPATQPSATPHGPHPQRDAAPAVAPGDSPRQPGVEGTAPSGAMGDDTRLGAARTAAAVADAGVPSPGDTSGVSVPDVKATRGTSEESEAVAGVRATSIAQTGRPDGEVAT